MFVFRRRFFAVVKKLWSTTEARRSAPTIRDVAHFYDCKVTDKITKCLALFYPFLVLLQKNARISWLRNKHNRTRANVYAKKNVCTV